MATKPAKRSYTLQEERHRKIVSLTLSDAARKRLASLARSSNETRSALVERLVLNEAHAGPGSTPRRALATRDAAARVAKELDALERVFERAHKAAGAENVDVAVLANFLVGFVEPAVLESTKTLRELLAQPTTASRRKAR